MTGCSQWGAKSRTSPADACAPFLQVRCGDQTTPSASRPSMLWSSRVTCRVSRRARARGASPKGGRVQGTGLACSCNPKKSRMGSLTSSPPTPPWGSLPGGLIISNSSSARVCQHREAKGGSGCNREPCLPTAPTTAHHSPQLAGRTGHTFRGPRPPFRAPRHPQPHIHAVNIHFMTLERGEVSGTSAASAMGGGRARPPMGEPAHQTPRKSEQGFQKNVRSRVGSIYPL